MRGSMTILGDPHLGRQFVHGVPLHRRGERENLVWEDFARSLSNVQTDVHVCMGDLFDKAVVPYDVIIRASRLYRAAALRHPETRFIILRGNHDARRDLEKVSAFDLFKELTPEVTCVTDYLCQNETTFFGWHPTMSAKDMVLNAIQSGLLQAGDTVFGHWDIESYGGDDHNLIPTAELAAAGIKIAFTGHVHRPQLFARDGVEVNVVGSMQPYAHGEEINEDLYVTRSYAEYLEDPSLYHDKCLRLLLEPGDRLDGAIDCLQLTTKRVGEDDTPDEKVGLGDFDLMKLFSDAFTAEAVPADIQAQILDRFNAQRIAN
jgi:DNA repair exonuclease SbcCD nuclease subunit